MAIKGMHEKFKTTGNVLDDMEFGRTNNKNNWNIKKVRELCKITPLISVRHSAKKNLTWVKAMFIEFKKCYYAFCSKGPSRSFNI